MSKNKHILDKAVLPAPESNRYFQLLERHPYICSLLFCLLLNPLYFGSENGIPANALMLETVALLIIGFYLLWRLVRYQPHRRIPAAAAGIGFTVLVLLGAEQYRKAVHPGLWLMLGGCAILAGILWLTRKTGTEPAAAHLPVFNWQQLFPPAFLRVLHAHYPAAARCGAFRR